MGAFSLAAGSSNAAFCLGWGCWGLLPVQLHAELPEDAGMGLCQWLAHYHSLSLSTALFKTKELVWNTAPEMGAMLALLSLWVQLPPINGIGALCAPLEHPPLSTLLCNLGVYCSLLCFLLKWKKKTISTSPTLPSCSLVSELSRVITLVLKTVSSCSLLLLGHRNACSKRLTQMAEVFPWSSGQH